MKALNVLSQEKYERPALIKAGDRRVLLGVFHEPPKVDCYVIAAEKAEAARLEQQRVDGIRNVIGSFTSWVNSLVMKSSDIIENEMLNLSEYQILDEQFMEFAEEARSVKTDALRTANEILTVVKQREADVAIAEQSRIELEAAQKRIAELEAASKPVVSAVEMVIDTNLKQLEVDSTVIEPDSNAKGFESRCIIFKQTIPEIDGQFSDSKGAFDPKDSEVIEILADAFEQPESTIVRWLNSRILSGVHFQE